MKISKVGSSKIRVTSNKKIKAGSENSGNMRCVKQQQLNVSLPDRITLTDNGAYDLEKKGIDGCYVWVGYEHKGSRSEAKMAKVVKDAAYDIVAPALAKLCGKSVDDVKIENHIDSSDMYRVWIASSDGEVVGGYKLKAPVKACDMIAISSCKYDTAIDLISSAIESLAEIARDDQIAKDSIANLGVVMLDLKGGC